MANLASAEQKWTRKTQDAGSKWAAATQGKGAAYCEGMARFLGSPVPGCPAAAFDAGVAAVGANGFQQAVQGKGNKWASRMRESMSGGYRNGY